MRARPYHLIIIAATAAISAAAFARADCECDPRPLDVVVCVDSTGSMASALDGVKKRISRLLQILRENTPRVRVGLVTYRDNGDDYVRRGTPLTEDFAKVEDYLRGISASGGGDTPEAVEEGLEMSYSVSAMGWDDKAKRVVVIVADAPPHDDKKSLCLDLAKTAQRHGIVTYAISVDGSVTALKEIATAGGGRSVDLTRADDIARHVLALALDRDADEWGDLTVPSGPSAADIARGRMSESRAAYSFVQLRWDGDWDPPHAYRRFLRALKERAGIDAGLERKVVHARDQELSRDPLVYLTGHGELRFPDAEVKSLQDFVARGGTLLIERCCDAEGFDRSARALAARIAPGAQLREAGPDHPVYRSGSKIASIELATAHGAGTYRSKRPVFLEARVGGRPAVIYLPEDIGCAWSGFESGRSCAVREKDALKWSVNVFLYALGS